MLPRTLAPVLVVAGLVVFDQPAKKDAARKDEARSVSEVGLEVHVLRLLHHLQATPEQMKAIQKLAGETASPLGERKPKVSKEYTELLNQLRDALAEADDPDRIDELETKLDELNETETPSPDDGIEFTNAARRRAPEVLRLFKPAQVASYFGEMADDVPDPMRRFLEAMNQVRGLQLDDWKEQKEEIAQDIGYLLAGADGEKLEQTNEKVIAFLGKVRPLKEEEFKRKKADLEKEAKEIIGNVGPTDVLHNILEYSLAEMLSNPRLEAALKARLGKGD